MRFVKTSDLSPGMRLAKPIYNKLGVLLYERDTKLNAQGIESIKNFELIGIYILEPAEPVPPLSDEDIAFEQFQTISMFQLRACMEQIKDGKVPQGLNELVQRIILKYGSLDHKLNFMQNLRSSNDFIYKHSISTAILTAMISHEMNVPHETQITCVTAALLYDIGYLFVPPEILDKGRLTNAGDQKIINECKKIGFERLSPKTGNFLENNVLKIISQTIYVTSSPLQNEADKIPLLNGTKILKVADAFDRMTAMNIDEEPVSEMVAVKSLFEHPEAYESRIVGALSTSIHILPAGCCVDLSTNEKALVLMDNSENFLQPLILKFSDNQIYDLRDPKIFHEIQIHDIMKTMDNRIAIDEQTLKHFYADDNIRRMADNFRKTKKLYIEKGRYGDKDKISSADTSAIVPADTPAAISTAAPADIPAAVPVDIAAAPLDVSAAVPADVVPQKPAKRIKLK